MRPLPAVPDCPGEEPHEEEVGPFRLTPQQCHRHREHTGGAGEKVGGAGRRGWGCVPSDSLPDPHSAARQNRWEGVPTLHTAVRSRAGISGLVRGGPGVRLREQGWAAHRVNSRAAPGKQRIVPERESCLYQHGGCVTLEKSPCVSEPHCANLKNEDKHITTSMGVLRGALQCM